ncbi:MAG: mRNA surveillance protein pelota [Candidatus Aenigmarchaeota archaeon]|nr:mRNA surveillance protein pelota [Candidatus Aenigmarchaeota archaeon]
MKILKSDFERGYVQIKINSNDDLWYLKEVIEKGDLVKSRTLRSIFIERDGKKIKTGKKPMVLKIEVEKIDFQKNTNNLRLTGKIIEGNEEVQIGSYHSLDITIDTILSIEKEWKKYQIEKLKKAQASVPQVLIAVVDNDEATFGILKKNRVEIVSSFKNPYSSKMEEDKMKEYYKKIADEIIRYSDKVEKIILAGPGFTKEHVNKLLDNKKIILENCYSSSEAGINEIIKKGVLEKVLKKSEILKETRLINEFFTHLNKDDGFAVYGLDEIKKANKIGAIDTLLVCFDKINDIEDIAKDVEKKQGKIEIISKEHDLGEQFFKMGGIGAILRFKV